MSQSYHTLKSIVDRLEALTEKKTVIQKIYSTSRYVQFVARAPGITHYFAIGRGMGNEGLQLLEEVIPPHLRVKDNFLEYLRKHVKNNVIKSIALDEKDRILKLELARGSEENSIIFFWRGRDLLFFHRKVVKGNSFDFSNFSKKISKNLSFENFDDLGRKSLEQMEKNNQENSYDIVIKQEERAIEREYKKDKKLKRAKRKENNIRQDILKIQNFLSNERKFIEEDWESINFWSNKFRCKDLRPYQKRGRLLDKVKNYKKGYKIAESRLADVKVLKKELVQTTQKGLPLKSPLRPVVVIGKLFSESSRGAKRLEGEAFRIVEKSGYLYGLGQSAQGNDAMRSRWAKKEDIWVHASDQRSPHVIIKRTSGVGPVALEQLSQAAKIIAQRMGVKESLEVVYTAVKNIKGVKNSPGKVTYKKEKKITIKL